MRLAALSHTEMAGELAMLQTAMSSAVESRLGRSPSNTFHVEVMHELATEFQKMEDRRSWLERPTVTICVLLLGPWTGQARLADHLDEDAGQLRVELAIGWEADAELEALRTSVARIWDLVLGSVDGLSSLIASMSTAGVLLKGRINAATADGVCWGSYSMLVVVVSLFLELKTKLEELEFVHSADMTKDEADALLIRVCAALDSLALHVSSSLAHNPPNGAGE
jgi:hypothetical protein